MVDVVHNYSGESMPAWGSDQASSPDAPPESQSADESLYDEIAHRIRKDDALASSRSLSRRDLARAVGAIVAAALHGRNAGIGLLGQRDLVTHFVNEVMAEQVDPMDTNVPIQGAPPLPGTEMTALHESLNRAKRAVQPTLIERIDITAIAQLERGDLERQTSEIVGEILAEKKIQVNRPEQAALVSMLLDDMLGLGPLEPLLSDDSVNDILVNGPKQVYVERSGRLELTDVEFRDDAHVMNVATRIVTSVGRRVDETTPLVDARLADGSRVNIIVPPLAIDGPTISIRKFAKKSITLEMMARQDNVSPEIARFLEIASHCRLNVLISGGTGSGKTTLLNAMSSMISPGERIVTIEDAAELRLQQPHVVRLETRTANLESRGEVTMRDLLKNALRMRPDRIILGEVRGGEVLDMLQAMNTGHDGSMSTIHANNPREALMRLENMVAMSGVNLAPRAVRHQMASAIDLVVQISRMRDGIRRIVRVVEIVGMEEEVVTTQELFWHVHDGEVDGKLQGHFESSNLRPHFLPRAEYFGVGDQLLEVMACQPI
jgi:pilus assembly protein CpaF